MRGGEKFIAGGEKFVEGNEKFIAGLGAERCFLWDVQTKQHFFEIWPV